jgi:isopenicillin-N epimerase
MALDRRDFLSVGAVALAARGAQAQTPPVRLDDWGQLRGEFLLKPDQIHLALMLLASHPRTVRNAIERHRRAFDEDPAGYFEERFFRADAETRTAVAAYTGGGADDIALTDSTTMALALLYGGLPLRAGQEVLTTTHDHYATHESLRLRALRTGISVRKVALYEEPGAFGEDEATRRLVAAIGPQTRAIAVTWVHSSTGVKLPIQRFAAALASINRRRADNDRVLLCVDGVHGFGVEEESVSTLGCDFFAAGCHKWMFGPRGTGILWGRPAAWKEHLGLIPSFEKAPYQAWMKGQVPAGPPGPMATPGGFHSFEHRWALPEAFALHTSIGRPRITARIHELARQCKEGLAKMSHVVLHTPRSDARSAGLVCFEVKGMPAPKVIERLRQRKIIGSVTPYAIEYARLSPGILNSPAEIDTTLREIRALAG